MVEIERYSYLVQVAGTLEGLLYYDTNSDTCVHQFTEEIEKDPRLKADTMVVFS